MQTFANAIRMPAAIALRGATSPGVLQVLR